MNKQEFSLFTMALKTYYPRENLLPNTQAMELWYQQLQDIPYRTAEAALNQWVATNKWSPSIADIRETAAGVASGEVLDWGEGWEQVLKAIRKYGLYRAEDAMESFDPIQAFVPPEIHMGDRNAMRNCLAPLIGYGEKYGTTFLIVEHANKQSGVWGRKRIADSADIWDISRSVIMAGETNEKGIRYLSHEKSNYGPTASSILYAIDEEVIRYKGRTDRKDKDFVTAVDYSTRQAPQREEAENFILEFLQDGEKEVSELDDMAAAMSIGKGTLKRAKTQLRQDRKIKTWSSGYGQNKKFYIALLDTPPLQPVNK